MADQIPGPTRTIQLQVTVRAGSMADSGVAAEIASLLETYPYDGDERIDVDDVRAIPAGEIIVLENGKAVTVDVFNSDGTLAVMIDGTDILHIEQDGTYSSF